MDAAPAPTTGSGGGGRNRRRRPRRGRGGAGPAAAPGGAPSPAPAPAPGGGAQAPRGGGGGRGRNRRRNKGPKDGAAAPVPDAPSAAGGNQGNRRRRRDNKRPTAAPVASAASSVPAAPVVVSTPAPPPAPAPAVAPAPAPKPAVIPTAIETPHPDLVPKDDGAINGNDTPVAGDTPLVAHGSFLVPMQTTDSRLAGLDFDVAPPVSVPMPNTSDPPPAATEAASEAPWGVPPGAPGGPWGHPGFLAPVGPPPGHPAAGMHHIMPPPGVYGFLQPAAASPPRPHHVGLPHPPPHMMQPHPVPAGHMPLHPSASPSPSPPPLPLQVPPMPPGHHPGMPHPPPGMPAWPPGMEAMAHGPRPGLDAGPVPHMLPAPREPPRRRGVHIRLSARVVASKQSLTVYLEGPAPFSGSDAVGLYVAGAKDNSHFFAMRQFRTPRHIRGGQPFKRSINFYAPTGHGLYEFRSFDGDYGTDTEYPPPETGRSERFRVDAQGGKLVEALEFLADKIEGIDVSQQPPLRRSASRLVDTFISLRSLAHFAREVPRKATFAALLWDTVHATYKAATGLRDAYEIAQAAEAADAAADDLLAGVLEGEPPSGGHHNKDSGWRGRELSNVQGVAKSCLDEVLENPFLATLLPPEHQHAISVWSAAFCPLTDTFVDVDPAAPAAPIAGSRALQPSVAARVAAVVNMYDAGRLPPTAALDLDGGSDGQFSAEHLFPPESLPPAVVDAVSKAVQAVVGDIIPDADYDERRGRVLDHVKSVLGDFGVPPPFVPPSMQPFGSSANGFGSESSDIDVCLMWHDRTGRTIPSPWDPAEVVEAAAGRLGAAGMTNVKSRSTARIPIVSFQEPTTGTDVDLCGIANNLAIRNTQMLRQYAKVDPRVRELGFMLKHWASLRCINNPAESTLSSYGYLLMLLSMLQRRPTPVIPNLQAMPPHWNGTGGFHAVAVEGLPRHPVRNLKEVEWNTYFFQPSSQAQADALTSVAQHNTESVGLLLLEWFYYYAFVFDSRRHVVSVRPTTAATANRPLHKDEKASMCFWSTRPGISVEDPFEADYDVAHVLRPLTNRALKLEFARAYATLVSIAMDVADGTAELSALQDAITMPAEAPPLPRHEPAEH